MLQIFIFYLRPHEQKWDPLSCQSSWSYQNMTSDIISETRNKRDDTIYIAQFNDSALEYEDN